jgi:nitrite reductase (NO-forming)
MTHTLRNRSGGTIVALMALMVLLLVPPKSIACDYCNNSFTDQITNGDRKHSLLAKEALLAMANQQPEATPAKPVPKANENKEFIEIINRDARLPIPPTSYVPQNTTPTKKVSIDLAEGFAYLGQGVVFKGFTTNGMIPGPTIIVEEGDIVEFTINNKGKVPHGASIHSAYTQTSKYVGKVEPGQSKSVIFKATMPGVYMYHCAPGGHAIPMHVLFGQYGMMVVQPKKKFKLEQILGKKPDIEIYLNQHEWYASGKDAIEGKPLYTTFNGDLFRYVKEPIKGKPGDYVRIYFLNTGPNLLSTFHIVGIIWDYVYWQGNPDNVMAGGQTVTAGPSDSWVIEFRLPPDEGAYLMLSHAVGSTDRGAIGILMCDKNAQTPVRIMADGPQYTEAEMEEFKKNAVRTFSPFEPGSPDVDPPVVYGPETKEVTIKIMGNSYWPKRVQVAKGTTIKWINEDVFAYMDGEYSGIHNAVGIEGPERFASPLLSHAESYEFTFNKTGDYKYFCTPHPYMLGEISVVDAEKGGKGSLIAIILSALALTLALVMFVRKR